MAINGNYVLRETTANLTRNITLTVASVLTVFVSLAILGSTVLVRQGAQNATRQFEGGVEFIVYVDADITPAELAAVRSSLEDNPGVLRAPYVDAEATYKEFQRLFKGQETMLENARKGDLPTSFRVEPKDKSVESVQELVSYYQKRPNVYYVSAATEVIREMKAIPPFFKHGLSFFGAFLLVGWGPLILNPTRPAMFARRREIEVMKLVGATNWFIRIPFMLEGLVQGLIGGALAVGSVFVAKSLLDDLLNRSQGLNLLQNFQIESSDVTLACFVVVAVAITLSVVSSALATRRFLDV